MSNFVNLDYKRINMTSKAVTVEQYINEAPEDRREALQKLRHIILENLPEGFQEGIGYGMIGILYPFNLSCRLSLYS